MGVCYAARWTIRSQRTVAWLCAIFSFAHSLLSHADDAAVQEARAFCTEMRMAVFVLLAYWPAITDSPKGGYRRRSGVFRPVVRLIGEVQQFAQAPMAAAVEGKGQARHVAQFGFIQF